MKVLLRRVAHVRSGDKGNTATIGVFAYDEELYPILKDQLTPAAVKEHYGPVVSGDVTRYEVDKLCALNFTAQGALGGGVSRSLAIDNFGKALAAALLGVVLDVPDSLANHLRG